MLTFIPAIQKPEPDLISKLCTIGFFFDPFHSQFFGLAQDRKRAEVILENWEIRRVN